MKAKKGFLAVRVGLEDEDGGFQRFLIPISYLYHPQFNRLLEVAQEVYGYNSSGPLKLPCSVDDFLHIRWLIERENAADHCRNGQGSQRGHSQRHPLAHSLSFSSC